MCCHFSGFKQFRTANKLIKCCKDDCVLHYGKTVSVIGTKQCIGIITGVLEMSITFYNYIKGKRVHDDESLQPIERPDPLTNSVETHDQILKAHLSKEVLRDKKGPTIEELSKMFFTTKHRWYPVGQ